LTEIRIYGTLGPGTGLPHEDPVKIICSVAIWPVVSDAIHAATAMLTATVTAMSMIDATTGLRAFLLFHIFILFSIPPFGVHVYVSGGKGFKSYDLIDHIIRLQRERLLAGLFFVGFVVGGLVCELKKSLVCVGVVVVVLFLDFVEEFEQ
jgi:hypothetical protein